MLRRLRRPRRERAAFKHAGGDIARFSLALIKPDAHIMSARTRGRDLHIGDVIDPKISIDQESPLRSASAFTLASTSRIRASSRTTLRSVLMRAAASM